MVLKRQVDSIREGPLQGGVGASMWKGPQEEVNASQNYRRILPAIVANMIKAWAV